MSINTKTLYYSITVSYNEIINIIKKTFPVIYNKEEIKEKMTDLYVDKLNDNEQYIIDGINIYTLNDEFHITTLFTGGKENEHSDIFEKIINKKIKIKLNKLAISINYIVLGVESINFIDNSADVPYYGNLIKHITIGLNKKNKVYAKNSYLALSDGIIHDIDIEIFGKCDKK
jgi:hypothetical protein